MTDEGLRGRGRRARRRTEIAQVEEPSSNLLARNFAVAAPNRVWVGDIKQEPIAGRIWYIAIVLDLYDRVVVGSHVSPQMDASLVTQALRKALDARNPVPGALMFHSDQGIQYRSQRFRLVLRVNGITQSMSRAGKCHDNATMESFNGTLEVECLRQQPLASGQELRAVLRKYLTFYNYRRLHSSLGYQPPMKFDPPTLKPAPE